MKKVFFPLLAVAGLTAMSFTDVKAETREVKEASMTQISGEELEGTWAISESVCVRVITKRMLYIPDEIAAMGVKVDNIIEKY